MRSFIAFAAPSVIGIALFVPVSAVAGESEEISDLKLMVRELQSQNRELSRRLSVLERETTSPAPKQAKTATRQKLLTPAADHSKARPTRSPNGPDEGPKPISLTPDRLATIEASSDPAPLPIPHDTSKMKLEERVTELEVAWAAQENATRQIIQDTLSKSGSKINSYLALSGAIEVTGSRFRDFTGPITDTLELSTTELDFDIRLNNWVTGALVLNYVPGTNPTFPTTTAITGTNVDRFTLDQTHVRIGDFTQFPIAARVGREVLHFGTSTGVARLDTLSIGTPLTTEVFENRQTIAGLEFAWPTPPLKPPAAPVVIPPVQPLVVAPAVKNLARMLGYKPLPQLPVQPLPITLPPEPPPFYGSFAVYKGSEDGVPDRNLIQDFNASVGYRTRGHCGRTYEELRQSWICPWTFDFHVDYETSVFDSQFLNGGYFPFLNQFGAAPGIAASVKASFGPFAVVGEVNSAIQDVRFVDAVGAVKNITPMAWQVSIAYQFDWNPWVQEIGQQGDFISVTYSGSKDLAGAIALVNNVPTRVGFVPQHRLFLTAGEWVTDGVKLALEYAIAWDYPQSEGGTGGNANGVFGLVQLNF